MWSSEQEFNLYLSPPLTTMLTLHHLSIFYRHTILVVSFDHRKIAISMSYVRIRLYSSAVDVYTFAHVLKSFAVRLSFNVCS
nr:MAG TPA: hypothetical protein [Caudoviricetes sp.]